MTPLPLDASRRTPSRISRRRFIESTAALGTILALSRGTSARGNVAAASETLSASTLARHIRNRRISVVEAVRECLATLERVNPKLNAVVTACRDRALAEASEADRELAAGRLRGPLHGVPFSVSDAFDSAGVVSTGGTLGRKEYVPAKDAAVVARARAAGAILLGKSNVSELANERAGSITTNLVCGITRNPYDPRREAAGASGGSGALVASGAAFFDIASSNAGAVGTPAASNGLAGLKPTWGRLPRTGHIIGHGGAFDPFVELGPLARRVEDLVLLLPVLSGPDGADAGLVPVPLRDPSKVGLSSLRIAHWDTDGTDAVTRFAMEMRALGAKVVADSPPQAGEFNALVEAYDAGDGRARIRRLLRKYGTTKPSPGLPIEGETVPSPELSRLREALDAIRSTQLAWVESYDLLICSAIAGAPLGWPSGIVRTGTAADGMPMSIQLVAQPWREDVLLAAMLHAERQGGGWQAPRLQTGGA